MTYNLGVEMKMQGQIQRSKDKYNKATADIGATRRTSLLDRGHDRELKLDLADLLLLSHYITSGRHDSNSKHLVKVGDHLVIIRTERRAKGVVHMVHT